MATFAAHVFVHGETGPVHFSPGDEVPEWADGLVGEHCLEPEADVEADSEDAGGAEPDPVSESDDEDADDEEPSDPPADAPDFTAPTPARRRSRTQK